MAAGAPPPEEQQFHIMDMQDTKEASPPDHPHNSTNAMNQPIITVPRREVYEWWLRIAIYSVFLLAGQSAVVLLGRLYFAKGGRSNWMATLAQIGGFPLILPLYFLKLPFHNPTTGISNTNPPSKIVFASVYVVLGLILTALLLLFSRGLLYLPVSTFSLIGASQLGFTALFSFFLNSQKLTPIIFNSVVLLTISSTLLVFQNDSSETTKVSKGKYAIGFICTAIASAGNGLSFSLTQLVFNKVLKIQTFKVVLDMLIYPSLIATLAILAGLFASGDWKGISKEMDGFELGKVSYLMTLIWTAICYQVFSIGSLGLIFEVSSLFSNVIGTLGLPVVPVLGLVFFHEKMDGVKVVALLLAIWGFVSYAYQHYIDDRKFKIKNAKVEVSADLQAESNTYP